MENVYKELDFIKSMFTDRGYPGSLLNDAVNYLSNKWGKKCTLILGLPFAARRMFDENGKEIKLLKGLQRKQLVYVSCGEQWIDPQLTVAEKKKRVLISSLTSDITLIRNYCAIRSTEGLVLEVVGELTAGAKLALAHCAVPSEPEDENESSHQEEDEEEEERKRQNEEKLEKYFSEHMDSHTKSHIATDALHSKVKYSWQQDDSSVHEEGITSEGEDSKLLNNRPQLKITKVQQVHRQQFEFQGGYIVNCRFPSLVLGVESSETYPGADVVLMIKRPDDINQRWILAEEERTVHLMSNPGLVLAVSSPRIKPGDTISATQMLESPIVLQVQNEALDGLLQILSCGTALDYIYSILSSLQNYKEYSYGSANQKWFWIPKMKVFSAYYATVLDQEITAANQASICTFSVAGPEELDQPGYYFSSSNTKETIICPTCSRSMRGKAVLKMLPRDVAFSCASGKKAAEVTGLGPYKSLTVSKVDLSTLEAKHTLFYYEEILSSLKKDISVQTVSDEISAAKTQKAVKIIAYKNGAAHQNGELIIATTFPMLLCLCTKRLGLSWPVTKLYTIDGTAILSVSELITWAVNEFLKENDAKDLKAEQTESELQYEEDKRVIQTEDENTLNGQVLPQVTVNDLKAVDEDLLTSILRNPIEVWASCGEAFITLDVLEKQHQRTKKKWLQKGKILTDLDFKKHRIRQLQGQRLTTLEPANIMPTKSVVQPVVVEGGWIHPSKEEVNLIEDVHKTEKHLSEMQTHQMKKQLENSHKHVNSQRSLYAQPVIKRVLVYLNGRDANQGTYVWGTTMEELLDNCTSRLNMCSPAQILYNPDGNQIVSWDQVERDMLLAVSAGEPFMTSKASKQKVEVRANYARVRKQHGPDATDIVISFKRNPKVKVEAPNPFLGLPSSENLT
ncbi:doublecortin domain-containing protein 1-like [Protopterus annectens]|uniref:doublecortin domain-containing protein 1-like n=1 Tax=Protopterus annectens TaxID=7888 RepID=UPI001CF99150|nr:doublecortin domain-containing protein 1-like [Protopterus annectens]